MIKNGKGGGNTKTGLVFEGKTDLATFLNSQEGYRVTDGVVFYNDEKVARIFKKHGFYRYLKEVGVDWTKIISKKLLPDDSIYVIINNTLFIIECKYQQVAGSVDEKLQTCDFKRIHYAKENSTEVEYEPYRNSVAGTIIEITEEYIVVDDSILCKNPTDGITYKVLLNDLRISRYVDYGIVKVGDTVQISYEGEIDKTRGNTIAGAISVFKATISDGDVLIPE